MAKDPATLWYWNDWQGGTMTMTRQAKGAYMDLLTAQFNSGHLTDTQIKTLLGQDQGLWVTVLREKFLVDGDGRYYSKRLHDEIEKRRAFSLKQSVNGKKGGRKKGLANPNLKPKESLLENENRNEIEIKNWDYIKLNFFNDWKWKEKFCTDKKIELSRLENLMREFISDVELKEDYKDLKDLKSHFTNKFNKNGTHQQTFASSSKQGTSAERNDKTKDW